MNRSESGLGFVDMLSCLCAACVLCVCGVALWDCMHDSTAGAKVSDVAASAPRKELQVSLAEVMIDGETVTRESMPSTLVEFLNSLSYDAEVRISVTTDVSEIDVLNRTLAIADFVTQQHNLRTEVVIKNQRSESGGAVATISA